MNRPAPGALGPCLVPGDPPSKRAGSMSDADRALIGAVYRTPPGGIRIADVEARIAEAVMTELDEFPEDDDPENFTPISNVLDLAASDRERAMLTALVRKIRNSEMRTRVRVQQTEGHKLRVDVDAAHASILDISGKSGANGKLGELRRRVDVLSTRAWMLLIAAIGSIGAAAVKLVIVTRAFDAVESRTAHNTEQVAVLQAQVLNLTTALLARPRYRPDQPAERDSP